MQLFTLTSGSAMKIIKSSCNVYFAGVYLLFFWLNIFIVHAHAETPDLQKPIVTTSTADVVGASSTATPVSTNPPSVNISKPVIPAPQKISSTSQLASLLGGLMLILVLIFGLSWFVKRFSQGGFMQNSTIKMLSAMPLGTRERLMLVEVGGKHILLGVTAANINTLHVFDEPVVSSEKNNTASSDFSQKLMAILQQKNTAGSNSSEHKNI